MRSRHEATRTLEDALGAADVRRDRATVSILQRLMPRYVTTTISTGRAMIRVAATGTAKRILSTADINALAAVEGA